MFTLEQLGTEWALELTHRCWVDIPGPCPGPLAWSSVTRGDYRKESIPALMTPCHGFSNWGCLSPQDVRVGEVSPGGSVLKEASLGLGAGARPCLAREPG